MDTLERRKSDWREEDELEGDEQEGEKHELEVAQQTTTTTFVQLADESSFQCFPIGVCSYVAASVFGYVCL